MMLGLVLCALLVVNLIIFTLESNYLTPILHIKTQSGNVVIVVMCTADIQIYHLKIGIVASEMLVR